ncbi:hypothetical protein H311_01797 [Anncaliia algerae PRA109]|nr:hypothetical protein H311_01797 [Anncaliia algerae PRA109]
MVNFKTILLSKPRNFTNKSEFITDFRVKLFAVSKILTYNHNKSQTEKYYRIIMIF